MDWPASQKFRSSCRPTTPSPNGSSRPSSRSGGRSTPIGSCASPTMRHQIRQSGRSSSAMRVRMSGSRWCFREQNGHISAASNSALELATGEWVALLDHDDLLPEHALALIAQAINRHPGAGLIYSDEDKIDEQGNRSTPYFKCEFNIDLLRSQNMICHLGAYRSDLFKRLGGFRLGFEGSQDYDLALRVVELLDPRTNSSCSARPVPLAHTPREYRSALRNQVVCPGRGIESIARTPGAAVDRCNG